MLFAITTLSFLFLVFFVGRNIKKWMVFLKSHNSKGDIFFSILIPARNEEKRLRDCLKSWLDQNYPNFEIIVYNDNSDDRTEEVVKEFAKSNQRVKLIGGRIEIPEKWVGKNYACYNLALQSSGEYLIFCDADVRIKNRDFLCRLENVIKKYGEPISIVPFLRGGGVIPRIFFPIFNLYTIYLQYLPFVLHGFLFCISRDKYFSVGGHQSVKSEILEDIKLGMVLTKAGYRIQKYFSEDVEVVMYENAGELIRGFSKNFSEMGISIGKYLMEQRKKLDYVVMILPVLFLVLLIAAETNALSDLLKSFNLRNSIKYTLLKIYVIFPYIWSCFLFRRGVDLSFLILHPASYLIFPVITINSLIWRRRGRVLWRGRVYSVD